MSNRCPELYDPDYKNSAQMPMCVIEGSNREEALSQSQLKNMCLNNCTSCYKYRNKYGDRAPVQSNTNSESNSSGSVFFLLVIIGVVAYITKQMGLW